MARKRDTGAGEPYAAAEAEKVAQAIEAAYADWDAPAEPTGLYVRARVEWAGTYQPGDNGKRGTRLEGLKPEPMKKVRKAVEKVRKATGRKSTAKPAASRKAKGWHAQLRELTATKNGSAAADKAGLNPSARTLKNWLGDADYPIRRGDRERIATAYDELRNWGVNEARDASQKAEAEAADALTEAMKDRYSVNVRLRDIEEFRFE